MSKVFLMLKNIYIKMMNYGWTLAYAKPTKQEGRRNVEYEANETLSWVRMDGWFNYWRYIYQLLWIAEVEKPFIYLLLIQYTSTLHRLIERAIEQYIYTSTSNLPHIHITSSDIRMAIVRWRLPCMIPTILILAITAATSSSFVFLDLDNDNDGHGWSSKKRHPLASSLLLLLSAFCFFAFLLSWLSLSFLFFFVCFVSSLRSAFSRIRNNENLWIN